MYLSGIEIAYFGKAHSENQKYWDRFSKNMIIKIFPDITHASKQTDSMPLISCIKN